MESNHKLLLHTCCAPCVLKCTEILQENNIDFVLYWFNPNIHPWTEYNSRKTNLIKFAKEQNIDYIVNDNYGLREFILKISPDFEFKKRCVECYKIRLENTVLYAKEYNYEYFSTSLLISPYQDHEFIKKTCEDLSQKYNIKFFYYDFRPYFREGQQIAREKNIYMQKYCGCIFSEEERYNKNKFKY